MKGKRISRREFLKDTSLVAAGTALVGAEPESAGAKEPEVDTSGILNYNPKMKYRRLGRTNLMVSEISLGGHWRNRQGGFSWNWFANDKCPPDVARNRTDVISKCIECGINYLDITTRAECIAYGVALKGRREKMIVGGDNWQLGPRRRENRTVEKLLYDVDDCLKHFKLGYFDIWRVQARMTPPLNTDEEVEVMLEAFHKLKKQGKAKWFGVTSHTRSWFPHIIEKYPEIAVAMFPFTAQSKVIDGKEVIVEQTYDIPPHAGMSAKDKQEWSQSIFDSIKKCDVGVCTIKPFSAGAIFKKKPFPVVHKGLEEEHRLARLTLQYILTNEGITSVMVGMTTVHEVDNNVRASYEREKGIAWKDVQWLKRKTDQAWADLPKQYEWLREWEWV
jgi:aryl-alcohol dehydrogenase-like predicted oxidoreductase